MRTVMLRGSSVEPIVASHAVRFGERLLGRWFPGALDCLLIDTAGVHTIGLSEAIGVVGLADDFTVVECGILQPNRFAWFRGARRILEMPGEASLPDIGDCLELCDV